MRILLLSNTPPHTVGGAEMQCLRMADQWSASGHKVTILGPDNQPRVTPQGTRILRLPILRVTRASRALSYAAMLLVFLLRELRRHEVVYCRFLKEQALTAALAKWLFFARTPLVACPACSGAIGDVHSLMKGSFARPLAALLGAQLNAINCLSSAIRSEVESLGLKNIAISSIPNGVFVPDQRRPRRPRTSPRIISIGRLTAQKRFDLLIEAAARIVPQHPDLNISIFGSGPLAEALNRQIGALRVERHVRLGGALAPEDVQQAYAAADLLVLCSSAEGMPGVVLEAMANGLPVIGTRCGGVEDIIKPGTGWLVRPEDPAALAQALDEALSTSPERLREMGEHARELMSRRFRIEDVAAAHIRLFADLTRPPADTYP